MEDIEMKQDLVALKETIAEMRKKMEVIQHENEECLESIKEPVIGSEEMERNRRVLKEKIRGLVSRSIGKDISSDNSHENSKASTTRSSSDRHGMRKEATSSDQVKPMTSSEEEISTRSRNLQTRQNSCSQHFEAIPRQMLGNPLQTLKSLQSIVHHQICAPYYKQYSRDMKLFDGSLATSLFGKVRGLLFDVVGEKRVEWATQPFEVNEEKKKIYEPTIQYLSVKYNIEKITVIGLFFGARGIIPKAFVKWREKYKLTRDLQDAIVTTIIKFSVAIFR
ncbi:hypothetical protein ANN_13790 [Periplaneta americana]|uniref:Uncharacterized protein n=1 Tax=Periplaneta americana TaxID=6978 RepID=A0ABQ8SVV3_PERAM|nr:hypothetical protein ANN_13790 [Periplaneta americana]